MVSIRSFWRSHALAAALIVLAALLVRSVVPSGYMIARDARGAHTALCLGASGAPTRDSEALAAIRKVEAIIAQNKAGQDPVQDASQVCPYAVLSLGALPAVDPIQLAAAIVFVLALGFTLQHALVLQRPGFLKPPMRGPPAHV